MIKRINYSIIFLAAILGSATASPTIVVSPSNANEKHEQFIESLIPAFHDITKNIDNSKFISINNAPDEVFRAFDDVQTLNGINFTQNVSTILICPIPIEMLNAQQLNTLETFFKTERTVFVVNFGGISQDYRFLNQINQLANCWATTNIKNITDATVHICNNRKVHKNNYPSIFDRDYHIMETKNSMTHFLYPKIFAEAAKTKAKSSEKSEKAKDDDYQLLEEEIQHIVEQTISSLNNDDNDDDDDDGIQNIKKSTNKLHCKYRKSCYETGQLADIESFDGFQIPSIFGEEKKTKLPLLQDADQDGIPDSEDDEIDLMQRKFACKYRPSCYVENNIPLSDKLKERDISFFSGKKQVHQGKKRTLKDIAQKIVEDVEVREKEAQSRPVSKQNHIEAKMKEIENNLNKKVACKYRKSCYQTGEVPDIEETSIDIPYIQVPSFFQENKDSESLKNFDDMDMDEKKFHCKYRKSCYETGMVPEIENEFVINSIDDVLSMPDQIETRKQTVQEKCKYRKSCYETGILPQLQVEKEHLQKIAAREVNEIVPSSVKDVKALCKYRKSCYNEIAVAETPEIVKTIRKRRIIEKEVRKRRARRHRRHRRRVVITEYKSLPHILNKKEPVEKTQHELREIAKEKESKKAGVKEKQEEVKKKKRSRSNKNMENKKTEDPDIDEPLLVKKSSQSIKKTKNKITNEKEYHKKNKKDEENSTNPKLEGEEVQDDEKISKKSENSAKIKNDNENENKNIEEGKEKTSKKSQNKKSPRKSKRVDKTKELQNKAANDNSETQTNNVKNNKRGLAAEEEEKLSVDSRKNENLEKVRQVPTSVVDDEKNEDIDSRDANDDLTTKKMPYKSSEENENNDEQFQDDRKLDTQERLDCKYRKSCYQTGTPADIAPVVLTTASIVHWWNFKPAAHEIDTDGDGTPDLLDDSTHISHRKLACKYRISCYDDFNLEASEKIIEREKMKMLKPTGSKEKNGDNDDDDYDKYEDASSADRKLGCKYRKSCYENGKLPTIRQWNDAPTLHDTIETNNKAQQMLKCKYRKSCYAQMGISEFGSQEDDIIEKEADRKPIIKETVEVKDNQKPKQQQQHQQQQRKESKKKNRNEDNNEDDNDDDTDDNERNSSEEKNNKKQFKKDYQEKAEEYIHDKEVEAVIISHLSSEEKNSCKYRKSCYSEIEPKSTKQDHSGSIARRNGTGQKCHIYYLSCREQMGLPPKEKAPIGPNGKRLCRKKKDHH